jgi:sugar phosphate isomerase/epimerase
MREYQKYFKFGIGVSNFYPGSFTDELEHLRAFSVVASIPGYETLETFMPLTKEVFHEEMRIALGEGKQINYNLPPAFQCLGKFNPCSKDSNERASALDLAKRHLDNACEAGSRICAMTSGPDVDPLNRNLILSIFLEYIIKLAEYAKVFGICLVIEPVERERFKKLLLGPTSECVAFIGKLRRNGCDNVKLMIDTAHCPLMEENPFTALKLISDSGIGHVHIGNAVLDERSEFYGHTHPAMGVSGGVYDVDFMAEFLSQLFSIGYLDNVVNYDNRPCVSYEMQAYPGLSVYESATIAQNKMNEALLQALGHNS